MARYSVERATPNLAASSDTLVLLSARGLFACSTWCGLSFGGRPPSRPRALATVSAILVRSRVSERSISERTAIVCRKRPPLAAVSMPSVRLRKPTSRRLRSSTSLISWRTLRPNRSSFKTTKTSPARRFESASAKPSRPSWPHSVLSKNIRSQPARPSASVCWLSVWSTAEARA
jgi:hypothetical protein